MYLEPDHIESLQVIPLKVMAVLMTQHFSENSLYFATLKKASEEPKIMRLQKQLCFTQSANSHLLFSACAFI